VRVKKSRFRRAVRVVAPVAALTVGVALAQSAWGDPGGVKHQQHWVSTPTTVGSTSTTSTIPRTTTTSTVPPTTTTSVPPATTTTTTAPPAGPNQSGSAPTAPPYVACGSSRDATMASPFTTFAAATAVFPALSAVDVPAGDNSAGIGTNWTIAANTLYYLESGTHTLGSSQYAQIQPKDGDVFVGAPGAIISGQSLNNYAFTGTANGVTIEYLEVTGFMSPGPEGVVNHDFGQGWTMRYNTVDHNHGAGMFVGTNDSARYNCLAYNGAYGFQGGGTNIDLSYNEIGFNDADNLQVTDPSCGCQGGGKFWTVVGATVTYNYVHDNNSVGLWADTNNAVFDIEYNYIDHNADEAIIYETSYNFKIDNNTFLRNDWVHGYSNRGFPESAVYISESGGDARVSSTYGSSSVSNNVFTDNWGGVTLWENADRYCSSGANTSTGYCTLVNPNGATLTTCADSTKIGTTPDIDDCRWKTQNVTVSGNAFQLTAANVPNCTVANGCGYVALLSNSGSNMGNGDPYLGSFVENNITFHQTDVFRNNTYTGPWQFMPYDQAHTMSLGAWQAAPYGQDAGSTQH
jgi:hypothetical protein